MRRPGLPRGRRVGRLGAVGRLLRQLRRRHRDQGQVGCRQLVAGASVTCNCPEPAPPPARLTEVRPVTERPRSLGSAAPRWQSYKQY